MRLVDVDALVKTIESIYCKDYYISKENAGGAMSEELEAMEDESDG